MKKTSLLFVLTFFYHGATGSEALNGDYADYCTEYKRVVLEGKSSNLGPSTVDLAPKLRVAFSKLYRSNLKNSRKVHLLNDLTIWRPKKTDGQLIMYEEKNEFVWKENEEIFGKLKTDISGLLTSKWDIMNLVSQNLELAYEPDCSNLDKEKIEIMIYFQEILTDFYGGGNELILRGSLPESNALIVLQKLFDIYFLEIAIFDEGRIQRVKGRFPDLHKAVDAFSSFLFSKDDF